MVAGSRSEAKKRFMRNGQLDNVLRHIRSLAAAQQTRKLPDRELLERFVTDHDEAAFAAIVQRHGPLVVAFAGASSVPSTTPRTPARRPSLYSPARPLPSASASRWPAGCTRSPYR